MGTTVGEVNHRQPEPGTKTGAPQEAGPRPATGVPLRLAAFDWSGFIAEHFSLSVLTGAVAAGVGVLSIDPAKLPTLLVYSPLLVGPSLVLAFTRVWKTIREEHETSALWEQLVNEVSPRGTGLENVKDAVFEIPYLFSILILPFSAVFFQAFAACLLLFYVCDNYYNLALVRKIGTDDSARLPRLLQKITEFGHRARRATGDLLGNLTGGHVAVSAEPVFALLGAAVATGFSVVDPAPKSIDRVVLMRYFGRRARLDTIAIWLLGGTFAATTILAALDQRDWGIGVGLLAVLALLVVELILEPFRALGVQYQPTEAATGARDGELLLWAVPHGATLDSASRAALEDIHQRAFPPAERQYEVEDMFAATGRGGRLLLLLTEREEPTAAQVVAGYVFLEARPERHLAFLWYLAVAEHRRGHGLGHTLVGLALDVVHDRWPSVRAVFLETARPAPGETENAPSDEMRRIRFYRDIGFTWVRDLDYAIPAADDRQGSLSYDPMFFRLRGKPEDIRHAFVKEAVLEMARDNFSTPGRWPLSRKQPDDPRWKDLVSSTDRVFRMHP